MPRSITSLLLPTLVLLGAASLRAEAQPNSDPDEAVFRITNLRSLNSDADDYAPFRTANGQRFYFTSSRTGSADLYYAEREADGWGSPAPVDNPEINGSGDDGIFSAPIPKRAQLYDLDTEELKRLGVPTLGVMAGGKRQKGRNADLYTFSLSPDGTLLSDFRPIEDINTSEWESQPSIAPDGSFIIFTSVREDGEGGMDLYISDRRPDGSYGPVRPLGETINTSDNEFSPFIAPDGVTLFFASTGRSGYGGADLYRSQRNIDGTWQQAENLGPKINTDANELFFYGINRERCYFVSDRDDGMGGLDLYEATPNIFMPGYAMLEITMRDTTASREIGGQVAIVEETSGRIIATRQVEAGQGAVIPMLAGFAYTAKGSSESYRGTPTYRVADFAAESRLEHTFRFGTPPPPPPPPKPEIALDFEGINIPLFVSGYYRMNTPTLLDDLRRRQKEGTLSEHGYIQDVAKNDRAYNDYMKKANEVKDVLDNFAEKSLDEYFPNYLEAKKPNEYLEIIVYGFADPRPIDGVYPEGPVTFYDSSGTAVTVQTNEPLDNFKLAGLRAYYSAQYLDQYFRNFDSPGREAYLQLVENGMVRWRPVSGNVDMISSGDFSEKRRIRVSFQRRFTQQ